MNTSTVNQLSGALSKAWTRWRDEGTQTLPLASGNGKPRVLYFLVGYPNFSETYMHEEIRSLSEEFEIKIITYKNSGRPRRRPWQYQLIEYKPTCLVYSRLQDINQDFTDPEQQEFLQQVSAVIEDFKPHIMHGHYLGLGLLMNVLAEKHQIPFTVRTHSMDVLSEPDDKLNAYCEVANSPWCKRVLAFPASRERLIAHGLDPSKVMSSWPLINFQRFYRPEPHERTNRILCAGPAIKKKAHTDFIDLASMMGGSGFEFDLYIKGALTKATDAYNKVMDSVVRITYADPEEMPDVYPNYDWMVYPSDPAINKVGLPVGLAEAMASGIGVCWQELPGRRQEQLDFLNGAGYLFKSIEELPELLSQPYAEEKRQLGFEAARRCDVETQKHLVSDVWNDIALRVSPAEEHLSLQSWP
jgi:glycosyltransferase involved in cell wall biosynthesis